MWFGLRIAAAYAAICLLSVPAMAQQRLALVIGNGDYAQLGRLPNPVPDAQLIASTLRELSFETDLVLNAGQLEILQALKRFSARLRAAAPGRVALFYFAGHGAQTKGVNYLIPTGVEIASESELELEAISASMVLSQMQGSDEALNILILDACRDNPFAKATRSSAGGLARFSAGDASGALIAFAAAPGQVASDGGGTNSPYSGALAQAMRVPGLTVEQVFKNVRIAVERETKGAQTPWEESSLRGEFRFVKGAPAEAGNNALAEELAMWELVNSGGDADGLRAFLARYPTSAFAELAALRLKELERDAAPAQDEPKPRILHTEGKNGAVFVRGQLENLGGGEWVETNTQNGDNELHFRETERSKDRIVLFDEGRELYLEIDLKRKRLRWKQGDAKSWNPLYRITRIE
jgi:uncharacterized caspase-like protein